MSSRATAASRRAKAKRAHSDDEQEEEVIVAASSSVVTTTTTVDDGEETTTTTTRASRSRTTAKVRKTDAVTQPTMERYSKRLAASAEDVAAKELVNNPFALEWTENGTMWILDNDETITPSDRIASFDMDGTLIRTKSGRQFPTNRKDWVWFHAEVPKKLKKLHDDGWKIVIFTNQNGISKGHQSGADIKGKILDLVKDAGVPMQAFVATADDPYRKPSTNMFTAFTGSWNGGIAVDKKQSVYVGDAAGRAANWDGKGTKKDFSAGDRKFAHNCGLTFHTPEEYFLGHKKAAFSLGPDLSELFAAPSTPTAAAASSPSASSTAVAAPAGPYHVSKQEMIVFNGFPAAGKSTFARTHLVPHGYVHVNQDTMKTKEKCLKASLAALQEKRSVVIDNTNPGADTRALYIAQAKKHGVPVRCFHFSTTLEMAQHLNVFRERLTDGAHKHVPRIGYAMYKKNFDTPTMSEGFTEVKTIDFVPTFPSTPDGIKAKTLFYQLS